MTQEQLDAMKAAAVANGKPTGIDPALKDGAWLVRKRDDYKVQVQSTEGGRVTLKTGKGEVFNTAEDSDLIKEFEVRS